MKGIRKLRSNMAVNYIGATVLALVVLAVIVSLLGLASFTQIYKDEYSESTYHIADTASSLVNGDHLEKYLASEEMEEYYKTKSMLDSYCRRIHVSLIYVIQVDRSDYGRFISIFNIVDNTVGDTSYTEWELGHKRDTTNDEYRQKYKSIYDQKATYETVYRINPNDGSRPHITTMVPVKDSDGEVTAILCVQRPLSELQAARKPYLRNAAISTILLSLISSAFAAVYIRKHFVDPVLKVSDEATRFARENTKGEELGEISKFKEIAQLAESIDTMETDMVSYIKNMTAVTAEKERISAELGLASKIQENSVPNDFPAFPERTEFEIHASMDPAKEVGGDFYNFFLIDDDHLAMVIGDVSGKGIPAALFMMVTNILVSDRTQMGGGPAEILAVVNDLLCTRNSAGMFVSVWLGILEISTGKLTAANAGHEYPAICRAGCAFELFKDKHGFVLGGLNGMRYRDYELQLLPGDKLFIYTDGVPEATDADKNMLGTERMLGALNEDASASPERILRNVRGAVDGFAKDTEQFDDLTMLCVEYKGANDTGKAV